MAATVRKNEWKLQNLSAIDAARKQNEDDHIEVRTVTGKRWDGRLSEHIHGHLAQESEMAMDAPAAVVKT